MAYRGVLDDIRTAVAMEVPERLPVFLCSEEARFITGSHINFAIS